MYAEDDRIRNQSGSRCRKRAIRRSSKLINAKNVFISNAGVDGLALAAFEQLGEPHQPYNQFYAAMKSWGRYEFVSAPADPELVFDIRFGAPLAGSDKMST